MGFLQEETDGERKDTFYNYDLRQVIYFFQNPGKNFLPALNTMYMKINTLIYYKVA